MYGNYMYGIIVWKSLFDHVWVKKTLTHNKGVLVGLSSILKVDLFWFWFGRNIFGKNGENTPFLFSAQHPFT